jgi:multidrug efflux pump subunit AcrB
MQDHDPGMVVLIATVCLNLALFKIVPKGFFPQQDIGRVVGSIQADQSISFQAMRQKLAQLQAIVQSDPAVVTVKGYTGSGSGQTNSGFVYIDLKPPGQRRETADEVIGRLRRKLAQVAGARLYLHTLYDAFGQRQVSVIYSAINQYHVVMEVDPRYWQDPSILNDLYVSTSGASPSGTATSNAVAGTVTQSAALPSPGSSATASTSSQTASVEGAEARNAQTNALANTGRQGTSSGAAVSTSQEPMVPLAAFSHFEPGHTPLAVNHQGLFVASTISFNLLPGVALGDAADEIKQTMAKLHAPATIHGSLQGTAHAFEESLANESFLILAALAAIYIVLGIPMKASFTRSPFSPPCLRLESARCLRFCCFTRSSASSP